MYDPTASADVKPADCKPPKTADLAPRFYLGEDDFDGQVLVSLESFLCFDQEITQKLEGLEQRWSDWSTQRALLRRNHLVDFNLA